MQRESTPRERGKRSSRQLIAATLLLYPTITQAAPVGGQVVSGAGSMSQSGSTTTITQSSQNLSLNWKSFNVAPKETVNFVQPSASAIAVNRIFDTNGTKILGHLNANGQVYLINPNGILFGAGAQVNVGGLVASTLDLNDASLNSNVRSFSGNGTGSVINQGTITAANGGYVALLGNTVRNPGTIIAQLGSVALGAGSAVTLTFGGNSLVSMQVDQSTLNNLAENGGLIQADGGMVIMSAGAKDALLASVVNNAGVIDARTVENRNGTITLLGGMAAGQTNVSGTLDASAPNGGNGGFIETSAAHVSISNGAQITTAAPMGVTGTWLIDPQDFTVAASGGDITGNTLAAELANTSIQLQSSTGGTGGSGNVNINDAVSWGANTILTLTASNNVNVNANITAAGDTAGLVIAPNMANGTETASGTGVFNLNSGAAITLSGLTPSLSIAGNAYTVINSLGAAGDATSAPVTPSLQGIAASNLSGYYALGSNIDATATSGWNNNAGFTPIGSVAAPFTGTFDGLGHTIGTLTVNLPAAADIGLFGSTGTASTIRDVGLVGGSVIGTSSAGALVGSNTGTVSNSYATGSVGGGSSMGGLLGSNTGTVSNSYATGNVNGTSSLGGLMGSNTGPVSNSYATGSVSGTSTVGGLMGSSTGALSNSYATGSVSGTSTVGGLMGSNTGPVSNSYATGNVVGTTTVGGLMGSNTGLVSDTYATGNVSGTGTVGALMGSNTAVVSDSYWNSAASGQTTSAGGSDMSSAAMMQSGSFSSWDLATTWIVYDGLTNPLLRSFMTPVVVTANNASKTYDGLAYSGGNGVTYSTAPTGNLLGSVSYGGSTSTSQGAISAGGYVIAPGGLYSNQQGYVISYANGALTVNQAALTATANAASKTYDGQAYSGGNGVSYSGFVNNETSAVLGGSLSYAGTSQGATNAGSYLITPQGLTSGNYAVSYANGALTVNQAALTASANAASKTYDGQAYSGGNGVSYSGFVNNETSAVLGGSLSYAGTSQGATNAGSYVITPQGLTSGNYALSFADGALTVNQAALTASANAASKTYDGQAYSGGNGVSYSGFVNNETSAVLGGSLSYAGTSQGATNAGSYLITPQGLTSGNYAVSYADGALTVNQAALTATANATSKTYDGQAYSGGNGVSYSGFVNNETSAVLGGSLSYAGTSQGATNAGSYLITPQGLTSGNYVLSFANGALTVNQAALTATANATSKTYDGQAYSGGNGVSYSGFVNNETSAVLGGSLSYAGTSQGATNAGSYLITPQGLTSGNYVLSFANGALTVNQAALTATANATSKTYDGQAYSGGNGVSYSGFVNNETSAVLGGSLSYAGTSQGATNAGSYLITPQGLTSGNYALSFADGALTVNQAALIATANTASKTYDGQAYSGGNGVSYSGFVNNETSAVLGGSLSYAGTSQGATNAGSYVITPQGLTSGNYAVSYANGALTVNQAALTATANATSKTYDGQAYSGGNGVSYSGFVNNEISAVLGGSLSYAGTSQGATNAGSYVITPQGLTSGNYALSFADGALTVNQAALTASANATSKTYDGQAYSGGNGVSYSGFVNNETSAVLGGSLSYAGTSQGATNAGSYLITPQGLTSGNYALSFTNGALTVNQAMLTATANAASKTYDGQAYSGGNGVSYSGFVNNETSAVLGGSLSYAGTSQGATNAGSYLITPQGLTSGNYALSFANGALTVNQAALTINQAALTINQTVPTATTDTANKTDDSQAHSGGNDVSYIGFVNSEASAALIGAMPRNSNSVMVAGDGGSVPCLLRVVGGGMRLPNDTAGVDAQDAPCNISLRNR